MKADRLISLLLLLQSRGQCTAKSLAGTLEVSERTIYRDVDALGAAGVPVYAERGSMGGIALSDGYRRTLTHFNEDEIRALFASGSSPLADLGFGPEFDRAMEKLRGGFAEVQRRAAEKSRSRIHLDGRRWNQPEPPRTLLTTLRRAVWDDRRLEVAYEDRNRKPSTRTVDPLGLVSKAGIWYLVARDSAGLRTFRVDRVQSARELEGHFERPCDFELERYWSESSAQFAETSRESAFVITLEVPDVEIERVSAYWPAELLERRSGDAVMRVTFPGEEIAVFQLVAWAHAVTIVEPVALRDLVVARARLVLERLS